MKQAVYLVTGLLLNKFHMDAFMSDLAEYKLTNCNGAAFRDQILAYQEAGIVVVSEHTRGYYYISIAESPSIDIIKGHQNSCTYGDAKPTASEGKLICVWKNGNWEKRGPWVLKIEDLLASLIKKLTIAVEDKENKQKQEKVQQQLEASQLAERVVSAWS